VDVIKFLSSVNPLTHDARFRRGVLLWLPPPQNFAMMGKLNPSPTPFEARGRIKEGAERAEFNRG